MKKTTDWAGFVDINAVKSGQESVFENGGISGRGRCIVPCYERSDEREEEHGAFIRN